MKAIVEGKQVELTDWFPPHIKPVRPGWYHTGYSFYEPTTRYFEVDVCFFWDGKFWFNSKNRKLDIQNRWWRGLTKAWDDK